MAQQAETAGKTRVQRDLEENTARLKKMLGIGESFDLLLKEFEIGGVRAALLFVDGLTKDTVFTLILDHLADLKK